MTNVLWYKSNLFVLTMVNKVSKIFENIFVLGAHIGGTMSDMNVFLTTKQIVNNDEERPKTGRSCEHAIEEAPLNEA